MEPDGHRYHLSIKKIQDSPDELKIKISKNAQACSLITNFATRTCDNGQNLFAPFNTASALKRAAFGDASTPDCFLWRIPDFGLLKLQRDGSVFFGHGQDSIPLAPDELTFNTSGKLFLESLKVAVLRIKSKEAQLCEVVVADQVYADHCVQNSGCLKTKQLSGQGEFLNEGLLELEGTQQKPAILGVKKFQNSKSRHGLVQPTVRSSHLQVTSDNQSFNNNNGAIFEVSDWLLIDKIQPSIASLFCNKGSLKTHKFNLHREAVNKGFLQAHKMMVKEQQFSNKEFGQVKILDGISVESSMVNEGEINAQRFVTVNSGINKGTIAGSPNLSLHISRELDNYGQVRVCSLLGEGVFRNYRNLFLNNVYLVAIQTLINQTLTRDKRAKIEGKGLYFQGGIFLNEADSDICLNGELSIVSNVAKLARNKGNINVQSLNLSGEHGLENSGIVETGSLRLEQKTLLNNLQGGAIKINESTSVDSAEIKNAGSFTAQGNLNLEEAQIQNTGTMICKKGNLSCADTKLDNTGDWLMDDIKSSDSLDVINKGTLQLKDSTLNFGQLKNDKDLVVNSGAYVVNALTNKRLQLLDQDWVITDDPTTQAPHRLICRNRPQQVGEIECQHNLLYDLEVMPQILRTQADVCCSNKRIRNIDQLKSLVTPGKVTAWCSPVNSANVHFDFSNIGHLELFVNGPFATHYSLKAPVLSLHVHGPVVLGKDNEHLGTIAATHGPLTVAAHSIDGRYGKFYGKGPTSMSSNQGDILVGEAAPTKQGPYTYDHNGSYIASDDFLRICSVKELIVRYGQIISKKSQTAYAGTKITNVAGEFKSHDNITLYTPEFENTRGAPYAYPVANWTWAYSNCWAYAESSDQAYLRALGNIIFKVDKGINLASSILAGKEILYNDFSKLSSSSRKECPTTFTSTGRTLYGHGDNDKVGRQTGCSPTSCCSSTLLSGQNIQVSIGDVAITSNMSAPGKISIQANTALFGNNSLSRQIVNPTEPIVVDVTKYMQEQARRPGIYQLGINNIVQTEFPLGAASAPQEGDSVLLENPQRATPLNWRSIFNPLSTINLDLHLQQLLANFAGKVYAGKAKGNNLATILWANANKWQRQHNKDVMSQSDVQNLPQSMLLSQILNNGLSEQQQTLLCIAPQDINAYRDQGDSVANEFACVTTGDQTHSNNRIIAHGPEGITIKSTGGNVTLETQSHTVEYEIDGGKVIQQRANLQQELIAKSGPVNVIAQQNVNRTGTLIAAAGDVNEHAETGSVRKNPLILQTIVETRSQESSGLFSATETVQTSVTHQILPSTTISGTKMHDKAAVSIEAVATQDSAGREIVYESPNTNIEGLILADRTTTQSQTSGPFSEQSNFESKEKPCATPANIRATLVRLVGENARVNANIRAKELRDETEYGAQFGAKVAQMLCSGQSLVSSPLMSVDAGYAVGYETMIPPMLMVEKIIRTKDNGQMLFESAIIDKNRTEIIGKFVETTYQLKQWQTSWCHTSQVIPNEALVVVALAITLATQGAGVELMATFLQNITATTGMQLSAAGVAMVNAGFSTICSSMGTSLLRTGDPIQTVGQLASPAQLKAVAFNMASAGLCSQLGDMLDVNMKPELKSLADHVQEHALRSTVDALLNVAINDVPVDKALGVGDACKQVPLKAVAAYAANKICTAYLAGDMNNVSQKGLQTLVGGLSGIALEQSPQGFVAGATGALTAEIVGDYLLADAYAISDAAITKLKAEGKLLTLESIQLAILKEVHAKTNIAKIAAGGVAALTRQNPSIAIASATNAVDNDVAIRGSLYALAEFQALVSAASQALATLDARNAEEIENLDENTKTAGQATDSAQDEAARDLVLQLLQKNIDSYDEVIMEHSQEQLTQPQGQRSLYDRIVNPETSPFIKESSKIIRIAFVDAVNQTINLFSMVPNPVGWACLAAGTGRDLYQGNTTSNEIVFNAALAYGVLKGFQLAGRGIKVLCQHGKGMAEDITGDVMNLLHQKRYASEGRVPFVENPRAGTWHTSDVNVSNDLVLNDFIPYQHVRMQLSKNPAAPFNVIGHGGTDFIMVSKQGIHPKGLSQNNLLLLEEEGFVALDAVQLARLIKTAPGYVKGQHINLMACHCGKNPQGIAQQLATKMGVPVSAFTGKIIPKGDGSKFSTIISESDTARKLGVMKTFYPDESQRHHLIPLAALPAFLLTGDESKLQNINLPSELFDQYSNTLWDYVYQ